MSAVAAFHSLVRARVIALALLTVGLPDISHGQRLPRPARPVVAVRELTYGGTEDGSADLTNVVDLVVHRDGRVFVLDGAAQVVQSFRPDGRPAATLGRKGNGPGEFTTAASLGIRRDTLWVVERFSNRVTAFALATDRLAGAFRILPAAGANAAIDARLAEGYLMATRVDERTMRGRRMSYDYARVDRSGKLLATLLRQQRGTPPLVVYTVPAGVRNAMPTGRLFRAQPFRADPFVAISADGASLVALSQEAVSAGSGTTIGLARIALAGDTTWSRRFTTDAVPLTAADVDRVIDSLARPIAGRGGARFVAERRMLRDSLRRPASWPAVTGLIAGVDGTIWMKVGSPAYDTLGDRYWQLDASGAFERVVALPKGRTLLQASRSTLWVARRTEDDLTVIERYRL